MKKMLVTLAVAVSTLSAFAGNSPANRVSSGEEVNQKVLKAFKTEFSTASDVKWTAGSEYFEATFYYHERYLFAYYNPDGELLGVSRHISPMDLPLTLQKKLKEGYEDSWISSLFEVSKNDGTTYYVTLENADSRIVLKSTDTYGWTFYKKIRKA